MPTQKADARTYPTITRAEAEAWRDLHRQLARTRTLQDAKDIAAQPAPPHAKRFYAHLRSFVRTLKSLYSKKARKTGPELRFFVYWSGREDLNLRPLGPEPSALPG